MHCKANKLEETYLAVWRCILNDILGWSGQEAAVWADRYKEYLADPNDAIYHADPQYWAVSALIPTAINEKLSPSQRSCLTKELLEVFGVRVCLANYLSVDWKQYKSSINAIVEKYAA